jgi:hypothetical protein
MPPGEGVAEVVQLRAPRQLGVDARPVFQALQRYLRNHERREDEESATVLQACTRSSQNQAGR